MRDFQRKRPESKQKVPEMSAIVRARGMLIDVCGPRQWSDTRESWLSRGARRVGINLRRAQAIIYQEPIRLTADEYLTIEARFRALDLALEAADAALPQGSTLARHAGTGGLGRGHANGADADRGGEGTTGPGLQAHRGQRHST